MNTPVTVEDFVLAAQKILDKGEEWSTGDRHMELYIDQINGSESASGGVDDPISDMTKAIGKSPRNSSMALILLNDYHSHSVIYHAGANHNKRLLCVGDGEQRRITQEFYTDESGEIYYGNGVDISGNNTIDLSFYNIEFGMLRLSDIDSSITIDEGLTSFFRSSNGRSPSTVNLEFTNCHFDAPSDVVGSLIGASRSVINLQFNNCTETEFMNGHWVAGFPAGTDTANSRVTSTKRYL